MISCSAHGQGRGQWLEGVDDLHRQLAGRGKDQPAGLARGPAAGRPGP